MEKSKIFLDKRSKSTYIRKRIWNKELGKYDQSTILKFSTYGKPPLALDPALIAEHKLTEKEVEQYNVIAASIAKEDEALTKRVTLSLLKKTLTDAITATKTVDDVMKLGIDSLDELADLTNELKKQLNKHKNTLKKRKH